MQNARNGLTQRILCNYAETREELFLFIVASTYHNLTYISDPSIISHMHTNLNNKIYERINGHTQTIEVDIYIG